MKKLKSAEEYLDNDDLFCYSEVEDIIRKVQIDAIKTTAENCAEEADITTESQIRLDGGCCCNYVDIDKIVILNVADKMIEEL